MQIHRDTLMAVCQLVGIVAAALILPCSLILAFDTDFLNILTQVALAGIALAVTVAVWTDQEE